MTRMPVARKYLLQVGDATPPTRKNNRWLIPEVREWLDARDMDCLIVSINHSEAAYFVDFVDDGDAALFRLTFP